MDERPTTTSTGCTFFKKSIGNKNMRKRVIEEDDSDEGGSEPAVVHKGKKTTRKGDGALAFSTQSAVAPQRDSLAGADSAEPEANTSKLRPFFYESSRQVQTETDSRATAVLETETEFDKDARAIRERVLKQADEALKGKASMGDNLYKGLHGYKDHKVGFRREHTISAEKAGGAHGPLRASAHIRWSVRFDYQPDICKDYKETGYCGYGDSCKFMHDRGDYKAGWQIDRECEEAEKKKKAKLAAGVLEEEEEAQEDDDDELPFACFICRQPFQNPVITSCKHYFCEHCALKHHARNKRCFVCNKATNGVFNTAHEIVKKNRGDGPVAGKTTN